MNVMDMFSLKGKVAVLTGGRGMYGRQAADALCEAGARLILASPNLEGLRQVADELRRAGGEAEALYLDLGDEASINELYRQANELAGGADILVNNAVIRPMKSYQDDGALFDKSMRVNATGTFLITRLFGDGMAKKGAGSIINVASMQGSVGPDASLYRGLGLDGFVPDYYYQKGGMLQYTRFLASYYGQFGVRCNAVSPGGLRSHRNSEEFAARYADRTMLGRMAGDGDLKGTIVYLASDASAYLTGANIPLDGGYTAK